MNRSNNSGAEAVQTWERALSAVTQPSVDDLLSPAEAASALEALRQMKEDLRSIEQECVNDG